AGPVACCNLPQLRNVCGTQWGIIVNPLEMWPIPLRNQVELRGPRRLPLPQLLDQLGEGRPDFGCGLRHFNVVEHVSGMGFGFNLIQNFCCGAGPNARQQLDCSKPRNSVPRVLAPPQDTEHIFDVGCFQEFKPPYFTNGMLRRVNSISSWALW